MKKVVVGIAIVIALSLFVGCTTKTVFPYSASTTHPAAGTYKVLGRVDYTGAVGRSGYLTFLEHAKTVYPSADDIVNIMVDSEQNIRSLLWFRKVASTYSMTGIAIEYLND